MLTTFPSSDIRRAYNSVVSSRAVLALIIAGFILAMEKSSFEVFFIRRLTESSSCHGTSRRMDINNHFLFLPYFLLPRVPLRQRETFPYSPTYQAADAPS